VRERNINANLTFPRSQLDAIDDIPLQKQSMFEKMDVVQDITQIHACGDMSDFMYKVNDFLHSED